MMDDFLKEVSSVNSREDLSVFVKRLQLDLMNNPAEWQNPTLDRYLEALSAWIGAMDGYFANNKVSEQDISCWQKIATMLLAAKTYE